MVLVMVESSAYSVNILSALKNIAGCDRAISTAAASKRIVSEASGIKNLLRRP